MQLANQKYECVYARQKRHTVMPVILIRPGWTEEERGGQAGGNLFLKFIQRWCTWALVHRVSNKNASLYKRPLEVTPVVAGHKRSCISCHWLRPFWSCSSSASHPHRSGSSEASFCRAKCCDLRSMKSQLIPVWNITELRHIMFNSYLSIHLL